MPTKCMDWMEISRFLGWLCSNVCDRKFIYLYIKWKMDRKRIRLPWKTFYEYFLDSFILQRRIFPWLDYIVLMAISLVTSIVLEWFKKLIRYEKFIDWVKRLVTKEGVTVH